MDNDSFVLALGASKTYTNKKIAELPEPFKVKPAVQTYADLPTTGNTPGDVRKVISEDGKEYYWDGTAWQAFGPDTPKENLFRFATMPTAAVGYLGVIAQYIGATAGGYTKGYYYICAESSGAYSWNQINVQPETVTNIYILGGDE